MAKLLHARVRCTALSYRSVFLLCLDNRSICPCRCRSVISNPCFRTYQLGCSAASDHVILRNWASHVDSLLEQSMQQSLLSDASRKQLLTRLDGAAQRVLIAQRARSNAHIEGEWVVLCLAGSPNQVTAIDTYCRPIARSYVPCQSSVPRLRMVALRPSHSSSQSSTRVPSTPTPSITCALRRPSKAACAEGLLSSNSA